MMARVAILSVVRGGAGSVHGGASDSVMFGHLVEETVNVDVVLKEKK